jgi:alanine racemase
VLDASPGLVPVIKGNGYGFGNAGSRRRLPCSASTSSAVGIVDEVEAVRSAFAGDVLVLTPSYDIPEMLPPAGVVQTVAHLDRLRALSGGSGSFSSA